MGGGITRAVVHHNAGQGCRCNHCALDLFLACWRRETALHLAGKGARVLVSACRTRSTTLWPRLNRQAAKHWRFTPVSRSTAKWSVVANHVSRFTFLIPTPSTTKADVENCRFVLLTRPTTSHILWLLRSYWFASKVEGTEGQTVRKDCLAFLFVSIFRSAPPNLPALLSPHLYPFASGRRYLPAADLSRRVLLSTGPPRNGWAICRLLAL